MHQLINPGKLKSPSKNMETILEAWQLFWWILTFKGNYKGSDHVNERPKKNWIQDVAACLMNLTSADAQFTSSTVYHITGTFNTIQVRILICKR